MSRLKQRKFTFERIPNNIDRLIIVPALACYKEKQIMPFVINSLTEISDIRESGKEEIILHQKDANGQEEDHIVNLKHFGITKQELIKIIQVFDYTKNYLNRK